MTAELSIRVNKTIRDFYNETNIRSELDTVDVIETLTALRCIYRNYYAKLDRLQQVEQLKLIAGDLGLRTKES